MRLLALALLLAAAPTWASLVPSSRCWLPDGPYAPTAELETKCPPRQTGGSATSISTSGWTASVDTTGSTGTLYVYVSASSTPPSRKAHISGAGSLFDTEVTVTASGHQSVAVTGSYTPGQFYTHFLHVRNSRPSNRITVAVTVPTGGGGNTVVEGYFWGTGGSDFNAGTSHAARFASMAPAAALSGVAVGTDVWGLAGSVHNVTSSGKFTTRWGGSEGDPVYIGCYYIDGSTPTACWEGATGGTLDLTLPNAATENTLGSNTLPSINGALTDACLAAKNCDWQYPISGECTSGHDHIAAVRHGYVWVYGMKIEESTCRGLDVKPGTVIEQDGALVGFRLRHSITEQTGTQALILASGIKYSLVHDSIGRFIGECSKSRHHGGTYPTGASADLAAGGPGCISGGSAWIYQTSRRSFSGFDNNRLFAGWTEVYHCLKSSHILMRGGLGGNVVRAGVYRDTCGDTIVERNMIWGPNGNLGFGAGTLTSTSTWGGTPDSNAEIAQYTSPMSPTNQLVRANIFVGLQWCAAFNLTGPAVTGGETTSGKFYHNSCIATRDRSIVAGNQLTATSNLGIDLRNNRFSDPTTAFSDVCKPSGSGDTNGDFNVFAKQPVAACRGTNDFGGSAATDTLLTLPVGTSASPNTTNINAWRAVSYLAPPDPENARPTAPTHTGQRLNNVQCISDADIAEWSNILSDMVDPPDTAVWKMCAPEYFDGALIADTPVVGALGVAP